MATRVNDTRPERGCLDADEVLSFLDGTASSTQRRRIEAHLAGCPPWWGKAVDFP